MLQATDSGAGPRDDTRFAVNLTDLLSHYRRTMPNRAMQEYEHASRTLRLRHLRDMAGRPLRVGDPAPDVTLPCTAGSDDATSTGAARTPPAVRLSSLLRNGPLVLKFYRGRWCPYCTLELRAWQRCLARLHQLGGQMVAVSPQNRAQTELTRRRDGLTMALVSDADHRIARQFSVAYDLPAEERRLLQALGVDLGAVNAPAPGQAMGPWMLALPALYLIDRDGRVAFSFVDVDFRNRAEPQAVLDAIAGLNSRGTGSS